MSTFTFLYFCSYSANSDPGDRHDFHYDADYDVANLSAEVWVDRADIFGI